jgi:hypothetical protein
LMLAWRSISGIGSRGFLILRRPRRGRLEGRGNPIRVVFLTLVLRDASFARSSG